MTMIPIPKDFQEFLRLLNEHKVRYLLIGGYAVAYHGFVRYTGDLDLFFELSAKNARHLVRVFEDFGLHIPELTPELFLEKGKILRLGHEPMRLEVMNDISGVTFAQCFKHRICVNVGGLQIPVIGLKQLIANKKASGRPKDLIDVSVLTSKKESRKSNLLKFKAKGKIHGSLDDADDLLHKHLILPSRKKRK